MSGVRFTMSGNWERDLKRMIQPGMNDMARHLQQAADRVYRQYKGKPVTVVKPPLKRALASAGLQLSERELTEYAQAISDGTQIRFTTK